MKTSRVAGLLVSTLCFSSSTHLSWAQPDANPAQVQPLTPEQQKAAQQKAVEEAMRKGQEQAMEMMKKTPAEQKVMLHQMMEAQFVALMNRTGFKDEKLQAALLAFVNKQEIQRDTIRAAAYKVQQALPQGGKNLPEQDMNILFSNYLGAVEDVKEEREQAIKDLDTEIGFSKNPNLMAFLTLIGFIGDASFYTGDLQMSGMMNFGSLYAMAPNPLAPVH